MLPFGARNPGGAVEAAPPMDPRKKRLIILGIAIIVAVFLFLAFVNNPSTSNNSKSDNSKDTSSSNNNDDLIYMMVKDRDQMLKEIFQLNATLTGVRTYISKELNTLSVLLKNNSEITPASKEEFGRIITSMNNIINTKNNQTKNSTN